MTRIHASLLITLSLLLTPELARAEWGDLTGRFSYQGDPPAVKIFKVFKDQRVLGDKIADDSLLVHQENRGVANIVVFLLPARGESLRVHPSYEETAQAKVELAMEKGRFSPHILLLRTTQTLVHQSKDPVIYNARIDCFDSPSPSPTLPRGGVTELQLSKEERLPCPIACTIHPWMHGYVLVRSNPYMAMTDANGQFTIKNLPVGTHTFRLWHERAGYLRNLSFGTHSSDRRGQLTVTIKPGENDLGDIDLAPKMFEDD